MTEPPPAAPLFEATRLVKRFGRRTVVRDVSIRVDRGEIVGLLGPNGAGKSTTFKMAIGLLRPDDGRISFGGRDVTDAPVHERARLGMGYLAQEPSVFRGLSVEDNLLAVLEWVPEVPKAERRAVVDELLATLHLSDRRKQIADTLSGGERRRLEITRILARRPSLILLDEPFVGVDPKAVEEIQGIVENLRAQGLGILLTDHNARETLFVTDRSYIIADGSIMAQGDARQLVEDPRVRRLYLGESFVLDRVRRAPREDARS
ncbi:MAG TPA: LPS export ABC transporter ATP-binding protein [Planctomycetota bacterium]|nr:LPS export ABC transporter ATP-binding protein [Planctomycetota bacterium]